MNTNGFAPSSQSTSEPTKEPTELSSQPWLSSETEAGATNSTAAVISGATSGGSGSTGGSASRTTAKGTTAATTVQTSVRTTASSTAGTATQNSSSSGQYAFQESMQPIWLGNTAYQEAVLPLEGQDGKIVMPLLYKAKKILKVENAYLTKTYTEGKDYTLNPDGTISVPTTTSMPVMEYDMHYPSKAGNSALATVSGGYERIYNPTELQKWLVVVTYEHDDKYGGPVPARQGDVLSNFKRKVENGEKTTLVFFGDSITVGGDVSGLYNCDPKMPPYPDLVVRALREKYPQNTFELVNNAKGGEDVRWGYNNTNGKVVKANPDLAVVAFGMNSSGLTKEAYKQQIKGIIDKIRAGKEDCDIVLVAGMMPNPALSAYVVPEQAKYSAALHELAADYERVAVADVKAVQDYVLTKKRFIDINANNINHNNDYFGRWYAQIVLETILPA